MYSLYLRERIVRLGQSLSGQTLVDALKEKGFRVSRSGVHYVLKKWKRDKTIFDYHRSGRPKVLNYKTHEQVNQWLNHDNELTINDILHKLHQQGVQASRSCVGQALQYMGWSAHVTRYCQLIRERNKEKRVEFCKDILSDGDTFDNVVFTDEVIVQLKPAHRKSYHKRGTPHKHRAKPKHPTKVCVWGGGFLSVVLQMW